MQLTLQNVGVVHRADIQLDGLTVLTGANGVGKSTLAKALYCATGLYNKPALDRYRMDQYYLQGIPVAIQQAAAANDSTLQELFPKAALHSETPQQTLNKFIQKALHRYGRRHEEPLTFELLNHLLQTYYQHPQPPMDSLYPGLHDVLVESVLGGVYHHPLTDSDVSTLSLTQEADPTPLLQLTVEEHLSSAIALKAGGFPPLLCLPSPDVLGLLDHFGPLLQESPRYGGLRLPDQWRHAFVHLLESGEMPDYQHPLAQRIESLIGGRLLADRDHLLFQDKEGGLQPLATCSPGVAYLGALQLLVAGGQLPTGSLLYLESPEAHLHPDWQLELAPLLTALAQEGVRVLLSTYSLTLIEALKAYSDRDLLGERTRFYWGELGVTGSVFEDVSEQLDVVFDSFSEALVRLSREEW